MVAGVRDPQKAANRVERQPARLGEPGVDQQPVGEAGLRRAGERLDAPGLAVLPAAELNDPELIRPGIGEDGSVPLGQTCSADQQCAGEEVLCGAAPFLCRAACSAPFESGGECAAAEYCRPEPGPSGFTSSQPRSSCVPSECTLDDACTPDQECAEIDASAGTCLPTCTYSWSTGAAYSDNCGDAGDTTLYCQPVGAPGAPTLACLPWRSDSDGGLAGDLCDPIAAPCRERDPLTNDALGLTCDGGVCRRLCDGVAPVCGIDTCCPVRDRDNQVVYSICRPSC